MPTTSDSVAEAPAEAAPAKLSREDEAKLALEHTVVSRGVARVLSVLFGLTIFAVPAVQLVSMARRHLAPPALERGSGLLPSSEEIKKFEAEVQADSPVPEWVLPRAQGVLARLGAGNKKGVIGRDGWLVYKPDVDYLLGRGFLDARAAPARDENGEEVAPRNSDAVAAIVSFRDQLARRGIALMLLPTPLKPMLEPGALSARYSQSSPPLQNPSYSAFLEVMARHKIPVCDPTALLAQARRESGPPLFLRQDTHWTPRAVQLTADMMAASIRESGLLSPRTESGYSRRQVLTAGRGDIAAMLQVAPTQHGFEAESVTIEPVMARSGEPWEATRGAEVMLLGDSFSNIYSRAALGWGQGAGLGEQLSFALQRPLDVLAVNAGGASGSRERLRDDLARADHSDRLSRTRVVVWQFAMRDLQSGDWRPVELPAPRASAGTSKSLRPRFRPAQPFVERPVDAAALQRFRVELGRQAAQAEAKGSQVLVGRAGWMFYLPDAYYLTTEGFLKSGNVVASKLAAPAPDDVNAILKAGRRPQIRALEDFQRQLARRGIALLVMPIPSKATIYADKLALPEAAPTAPQNPSFSIFGQALRRRGIRFFDPTRALLEQRRDANRLLFMPTDSHWTFEGMEVVAARLAESLDKAKSLNLSRSGVVYRRRAARVRNITDISAMLSKQPGNTQLVRVGQTVQQVLEPGGSLWKPDENAEILILGDSFSNIYSGGGFWGRGAGLAEQLSYYLQRPVDKIALDGEGVNGTRLELARQMKQGRDRLAGKKLVIFQVGARYLLSRRWQLVPLPRSRLNSRAAAKPRIARPYDVPLASQLKPNRSEAPLWVSATIEERSDVPRANSTPYGEMLMTLRLSALRATRTADLKRLPRGEIVVYAWGLRNQIPTTAASWKKGQRVWVRLVPWRAVEDELSSHNRSELEGMAARGLEEFWCEAAK